MKASHPIRIDKGRTKNPPGGNWQTLDVVSHGRVQILPAGDTGITQAMAIMAELERLAECEPEWELGKVRRYRP